MTQRDDEPKETNLGCLTLLILFLVAVMICASITTLTEQVSRIANKMEQTK